MNVMDELIKTPLDQKTLQHFKGLLLQKRKDAEDELESIHSTIRNLDDADAADYSSVTHHMGDMGTNVEEKEMNYKLYQRIKKYIKQIDNALERIENKTYGICQATGKNISKGRLEAVPHTRYSIEAKKQGIAEKL